MALAIKEVNKPYEHKEYPKWVTPENGKPVIVQNAREENDVMGNKPTVQEDPPAEPEVADQEEAPAKKRGKKK